MMPVVGDCSVRSRYFHLPAHPHQATLGTRPSEARKPHARWMPARSRKPWPYMGPAVSTWQDRRDRQEGRSNAPIYKTYPSQMSLKAT